MLILGRCMNGAAYDSMTYKKDVQIICSASGQDVISYINHQFLLRYEQTELLTILQVVFPPEERLSWDEPDYLVAVDFFCKDYDIIKKLRAIPFPKPNHPVKKGRRLKDPYDLMRKFYEEVVFGWRKQSEIATSTPYETHKKYQERKNSR